MLGTADTYAAELSAVLERRHKRNAAERERYANDIEAQRQRGREKQPATRPGKYDPEDYAEEWQFLTDCGLPADQIVARSCPSRQWFLEWVRPLVHDAICSACWFHFSPADTGTLLHCEKGCALRNSFRKEEPSWRR